MSEKELWDKQVGLTANLPLDWLTALAEAEVAAEFAHLDA